MATSSRTLVDLLTRAAAAAALAAAVPYLVWRLGWSHHGTGFVAWAVLLAVELVVLSRLALEGLVLVQRPRRDVPAATAAPAELVVVVGEEPLVLVRLCLRSCRAVLGATRVRVVDLYGREDVARACARSGVDRVPAIDIASSGAAFGRVLAEAATPVLGIVPASTVVFPDLLVRTVPLLVEPGVGAVSVPAASRGVRGLVGSGGYPLEVDDSVRLARGLDARGVALPLHGPAVFRTAHLRAIGGVVATTGRPVLATAASLASRGLRTRVLAEPLALRATPWSEDHALRERSRLVAGRLATLRRVGTGRLRGAPSPWAQLPGLLAALELASVLVRVGVLALLVLVPLTGWSPLSFDGRGWQVAGAYWALVALAGRLAYAPGEPFAAKVRRGYRTLSVDLRALAGRRSAPRPGRATRAQLGAVVAMLACSLVAGAAPLLGPFAGRLPGEAHGSLLAAALAVAWLARDALFAVEDRQRRVLPRTRVAPTGGQHAMYVAHLSPHGVDLVDDLAPLTAGDVVEVGLSFPVGPRRSWQRTLEAVVVRAAEDGTAYARFDLDDEALDELMHYCAVTVPLAERAGVVPSPVTGVRRCMRHRDPAELRPTTSRDAEELAPADSPLDWLGFYLGTPTA